MKELSPGFVGPLVHVRAEKVTLGLDHVGWQALAAVAVAYESAVTALYDPEPHLLAAPAGDGFAGVGVARDDIRGQPVLEARPHEVLLVADALTGQDAVIFRKR